MLRHDPIGTNEAWTPEARARILRETLYPATRIVGARVDRNAAFATGTQLDRYRTPYIYTAKTARLLITSNINPYAAGATAAPAELSPGASINNVLQGVAPFVFSVPVAGVLRAIRCRDYRYSSSWTITNPIDAVTKIRVRKMDATGTTPSSTILNAETVPFDVTNLNISTGGILTDSFEVTALDGAEAAINRILTVEFEFALDLFLLGA